MLLVFLCVGGGGIEEGGRDGVEWSGVEWSGVEWSGEFVICFFFNLTW